ncbi:uncharacterized protein LOC130669159 [Microplitis mediator]|uniref:uncharacterized protein LOC130669159 n=1 Tax=Microplitis mediator TaxID=375433 RepID=UPI002555A287|nr:uncharacterized protein LOC130669159 [Microplitis mediator]
MEKKNKNAVPLLFRDVCICSVGVEVIGQCYYSCAMGQNFEDPYYKLRMKEQAARITNNLRKQPQSTTKLVEPTTEAMETTTKAMKTTKKAMETTTKSYESTTNSDNLKNLENSNNPSTSEFCLREKLPCFPSNDKCCPGFTCSQLTLVMNPAGLCVPENYKKLILQGMAEVSKEVPMNYWDMYKSIKTKFF